jgi:hypothetical protein
MYPVDLLKVRSFCLSLPSRMTYCEQRADCREDQDPNHQPVARRHVQRHIQRHGYDFARRGLRNTVERIIERGNGRRSVDPASRCGDTALTVLQDPRTPSILRPTKPPNTPSAETRVGRKNTTLLQQVCRINDLIMCVCR